MLASAAGAPEPSDGEVIASSFERPEAFEALFERHAVSIFRYLRRRVGEALAEELTAETFARAFRGRVHFDRRRDSALPWLYGIAANLLRMHRRAEERRLLAYARTAGSQGAETPPDADSDERLDASALRPALAAALADLSHGEREVLLLHAWAELSPAEIALALDISAGTVRSRLHRARAHVAERLSPFGNKTGDDSMVTAP